MGALPALSLSLSLCLALASGQAAVDTLGGPCRTPVSASSCPHACPLIDGVATCVPVLQECAACSPARAPADGVCARALVCDAELRECHGVRAGERCETNGEVCDEGLVCTRLVGGMDSPNPPSICFNAGGEGEACDVGSRVEDTPAFQGCAKGLRCLSRQGGSGRKACSKGTGEGEKCSPGSCPEGMVCQYNGVDNVCFRLRTIGEKCSNEERCIAKTAAGEALKCSNGKCAKDESIPAGSACNPSDNKCGDNLSCASDSSGGPKCLTAKTRAGAFCGNGRDTCWREGLVRDRIASASSDGELRCEAGICAMDSGAGGVFQLCSQNSDCSAAGRVCAAAQDGKQRCLDLDDGKGGQCSFPADWGLGISRRACLPGWTCSVGTNGGGRDGLCRKDDQEKAGFGEVCDSDGSTGDGNFRQCVDTDGNGNRLICDFRPRRADSGAQDRLCLRRLGDGESCDIKSGACGEFDLLRSARCDDQNICRVERDLICKSDSDCKTGEGEACVSAQASRNLAGSAEQFACLKFSQQRGQECERGTPFFGLQTLKCADGLTCFNSNPGFRSVRGICVTFVKDGEQCNESQNIVCEGASSSGGSARSACINGSCQPL